MTNHELRDLLRDRVADESMPDLSGRAWRAGRVVRRRRMRALGVAAAVSVLVVAGVAGGLARDDDAPVPAPAVPTPSQTTPSSTEPDATHQGVPIWWSPDVVEEQSLRFLAEAPFPQTIGPQVIRSISATMQGPAIAAFGRGDEVFMMGAQGGAQILDVSSLDDVAKENGYRVSPLTASMLSPDGRHLVFPQDGSIAVYDIETGGWAGFSIGDASPAHVMWVDDETLYLPPHAFAGRGPLLDLEGHRVGSANLGPPDDAFDVRPAFHNPVGPWRSDGSDAAAQSWGMGGPFLPVRDTTKYLSGPAYLSVVGPTGTSALAFMTGVDDYRFMDAPTVAGWLDPETVVYESRVDDTARLVAWTVGTNRFHLVSRIEGAYDVASFASLHE